MQREQTKQQTKQQTIAKQNHQQNADVLKKTAPAMMQEKNEDAELDKILRRPRSKKKLKLYAEVDLPSMTDEEIMERMRKERASGAADGGSWGGGAQGDGANEDISKEDIAAYLQSRQEEFIKMVQGEIKEEEERERRRIERIEEEEKEKAQRKIGVLAYCNITDYVHFIPAAAGWGAVQCYRRGKVPGEFLKALHLYENCKGCNFVEIWGNRLAAIAGNGEVIKIEKF